MHVDQYEASARVVRTNSLLLLRRPGSWEGTLEHMSCL
jgi:hypothetical protein